MRVYRRVPLILATLITSQSGPLCFYSSPLNGVRFALCCSAIELMDSRLAVLTSICSLEPHHVISNASYHPTLYIRSSKLNWRVLNNMQANAKIRKIIRIIDLNIRYRGDFIFSA